MASLRVETSKDKQAEYYSWMQSPRGNAVGCIPASELEFPIKFRGWNRALFIISFCQRVLSNFFRLSRFVCVVDPVVLIGKLNKHKQAEC